MPELPDLQVYIDGLEARILGRALLRVKLLNPFLLRTAVPPLSLLEGRPVRDVRRLGKRIVIGFEGELFLVLHLMVAGRLRWLEANAKAPGRITLALLEFDGGTLAFTEAGTKRRASLHVVEGEAALRQMDPGGLEVLSLTKAQFEDRLRSENHTLKRALTDPQLFPASATRIRTRYFTAPGSRRLHSPGRSAQKRSPGCSRPRRPPCKTGRKGFGPKPARIGRRR